MARKSSKKGKAFDAHPRIFIVDDEASIAQMLSVILQMHLYNAIPFTDPQAAIEAARIDPPDYLVSDIVMQGMTGIELAQQFKQEFPACKVLLYSGQPDAPEMIRNAGSHGDTFHFLQKPIHPTEFVAILKSL